MANEPPDSLTLIEALKSALAHREGGEYRKLFAERHEEIMELHPTQQTYLEAWDRAIRVRQDRQSSDESLIWETEVSHAVNFLTDLEKHALPLEEGKKIREMTLGNSAIQSLEEIILSGWDSKAELVFELAKKRASLKKTPKSSAFTPTAEVKLAKKPKVRSEVSLKDKLSAKKLSLKKPKSSN